MTRQLIHYGYFRSSTSYRTRIALNLKNVPFQNVPVHLVRDGGEQHQEWYAALNPQKRVPSLVVEEDGRKDVLIQSPAILEWLEEVYPEPPLLPRDPIARAHCRAIAAVMGCDIHPLNNLSTLNLLKTSFGADQAAIDAWYTKWVLDGFGVIEELLGGTNFACGDMPTLADVYLVPQLYNARRYKIPLDAFSKILRAEQSCLALDAFQAASPERQADAA